MQRARLIQLLERFGGDAVAYQALEPGLKQWDSVRGIVTYCETGGGWVATGGPLAHASERAEVARAFVGDAAREGRRASFFACDDVGEYGRDFARIQLGEQPLWEPAKWSTTLREHRSVREQLRRARAKGVRVRRVEWSEIETTTLRSRIEALASRWLASRPMEPMQFLVTLALFEEPTLHRYYAAERGGELVAFLSTLPIGTGRGLLVEDLVRDRSAPNGTTELLFDHVMQDAARDRIATVTWGLAPLAGDVPWILRCFGALGRGLYDFRGLYAFKARLHPSAWQPVWLVYPRRTPWALCLLDALRAFAAGSLFAFGARTFARHPLVLAWALTLALIPWTLALAVLLMFHAAAPIFGFPRVELFGWVVFDSLFALLLLRAFWRPRAGMYAVLALAAASDGVLSVLHMAHVGLGASALPAVVRIASMAAPILAAFGLARCASYARRSTSPSLTVA